MKKVKYEVSFVMDVYSEEERTSEYHRTHQEIGDRILCFMDKLNAKEIDIKHIPVDSGEDQHTEDSTEWIMEVTSVKNIDGINNEVSKHKETFYDLPLALERAGQFVKKDATSRVSITEYRSTYSSIGCVFLYNKRNKE
jgi:hypothetical protein